MHNIRFLYHYFNYKPHVGILSAISSYVIAIQGMLLTDETLRFVAAISSCAACIVGCATALSWIIRGVLWFKKIYPTFKSKKP